MLVVCLALRRRRAKLLATAAAGGPGSGGRDGLLDAASEALVLVDRRTARPRKGVAVNAAALDGA